MNHFLYNKYVCVPVLATLMFSCKEQTEVAKKPNIIYILADDLGYAELGCYGQEKIETPNIDKLAERGMRFMQNYSGSPVSAPSRCVTFTGLHSGHAYIRGNDEMSERGAVGDYHAMLADSTLEGQRPLPAGTATIPSVLKQAGYVTGCIGNGDSAIRGRRELPIKWDLISFTDIIVRGRRILIILLFSTGMKRVNIYRTSCWSLIRCWIKVWIFIVKIVMRSIQKKSTVVIRCMMRY